MLWRSIVIIRTAGSTHSNQMDQRMIKLYMSVGHHPCALPPSPVPACAVLLHAPRLPVLDVSVLDLSASLSTASLPCLPPPSTHKLPEQGQGML